MRTHYLMLSLLLGLRAAYAQDSTKSAPESTTMALSVPMFKRILNNQFRDIITGKADAGIGNFATLDTKDGQLSFNGSKYGERVIVSANINGAITDGISALFTNTKLNTGVGINLRLHFLNTTGKSISFIFRDRIKSKQDSIRLRNQAILDTSYYDIYTDKLRLRYGVVENDMKKILEQKVVQRKQLDSLIAYTKDRITDDQQNIIDSLTFKIKNADFRINSDKFSLDSLSFIIKTRLLSAPFERSGILATAWKDADEAVAKMPKSGFSLGWWTMEYRLLNKTFSLIDTSRVYAQQISKQRFVQHALGIGRSHYKWSRFKNESYFWSVYADLTLSDNKDTELTEVTVSESRSFTSVTNTRTLNNLYKAYLGSYKRDLYGLSVAANYYKFLFEDNVGALHLFGKFITQTSTRDQLNLGAGFTYRFKKEDDETKKAIVAVELYVDFQDILYKDPSMSAFRRNEIGLRTAFPINFALTK